MINVCQINGNRRPRNIDFSYDYYNSKKTLIMALLDDPQNCKIKRRVSNKNKFFRTDILVENIGKGAVMNMHIDIEGKVKMYARHSDAICLSEKGRAKYTIYIEAEKLLRDCQNNQMSFYFIDVYGSKYKQVVKFGIRERNEKKKDLLDYEENQIKWELTYLEPISALEEIEESN